MNREEVFLSGLLDKTPLANLVSTAGLTTMFAGMEDWLPMTIGIVVGLTAIALNIFAIFVKHSENRAAKLDAERQSIMIERLKKNPE